MKIETTLDNTTTDEIVIVLNFVDTFSGEEKIKIGNAILEAVKNVFLDRGQLIESPELLEGKE